MLKMVSASYKNAKRIKQGLLLDKEIYSTITPNPIDKTLMEKSDKNIVVPVDIDWTDIGSWYSLHEFNERKSKGNLLESILSKLSRAA
jgi:mannose-1-phosphate guanylyltransferase/mannose-1-phosphate guanylyltransferase/mannose-6-phosphate isomerase